MSETDLQTAEPTDRPRHEDEAVDAAGGAPTPQARIDDEVVEEKVRVARESLRDLMRERRLSQRQVESRCGWTRGYLSQVLQGRITLTFFHVLAVLDAVGEPWPDYFRHLFPSHEPLAMDEIRERLDRYDGLFEELRERGVIEGDHSTGKARPEL